MTQEVSERAGGENTSYTNQLCTEISTIDGERESKHSTKIKIVRTIRKSSNILEEAISPHDQLWMTGCR